MSTEASESLFEAFLNKHDDAAWRNTIENLLRGMHAVDRDAVQIWFRFFPLALLRILEATPDRESLVRDLRLQGNYYLKDQIDSSHWFLYGHRYWPEVKAAISEFAASKSGPGSLDLAAQISGIAAKVTQTVGINASLVTGIAAVGLMTLQQVGCAAFKAAPGIVGPVLKGSADQIVARRDRNDSQGLFGFLRGTATRYSVTFDERSSESRFTLINSQHITTAAALDKRNFNSRDSRCIIGEGPIPVECRSASCGTCWVGVLGGREKLSEVRALESRKIKEFGYIDTSDPGPLIRLSCQAQAFGNVTIVIPPWNGILRAGLRTEDGGLRTED